MVEQKFHIIDDSGIKWWLEEYVSKSAAPYCAKHHLPLRYPANPSIHRYFFCPDCTDPKSVDKAALTQMIYAADKIRAKVIAKLEVINYNGELLPVAKTSTKNNEYGVTAQIMESKHGKQLVIYAGKKGVHNKAQIFVDTENGKLSFDHKDLKPTEIFAKIEATFIDGSKMSIGKNANEA